MKLTDLAIEQFGVWKGLSLDVADHGITVVHGPNEAGKSTITRFLSWALFGGDKPFEAGPDGRRAGTLGLRAKGRRVRLRRVADGRLDRSDLELTDDEEGRVASSWLADRLKVSQDVFDRVHSIGLSELHELNTLAAGNLEERVYGLSLGEQGRRLTAAAERLRGQRDRLRGQDGGELARLIGRRRALEEKLARLAAGGDRDRDTAAELARLSDKIDGLERRRRVLKDEIRGRRLLEKAWSPWDDARQLRAELAAIDGGAGLTADGLNSLDELQGRIDEAASRRDEAAAAIAGLTRSLDEFGTADAAGERGLDAVTTLKDWSAGVVAARGEAGERRARAASAAETARGDLPSSWTPQRLASADIGPERHGEFRTAATRWRDAKRRLDRSQAAYRKKRRHWARREDALTASLERFGVDEVEPVVDDARARLDRVESLGKLVERDTATRRALAAERLRLERAEGRFELPPWVSFVFVLFIVGGAISVLFGLFAFASESVNESGVRLVPVIGTNTATIIGLTYILGGIALLTLAYRMRTKYDETVRETIDDLEAEVARAESDSRELAGAIAGVAAELGHHAPPTPTRRRFAASSVEPVVGDETLAEWADAARAGLADATALADERDAIADARRKLSETRGRLRTTQSEVDTVRKSWCETLRRFGLTETLDVEAAETEWSAVVAAVAAERERAAADDSLRKLATVTRSFGTELDRMAQTWRLPAGDRERPDATLASWTRHLSDAAERKTRRSELAARLRDAERTAAEAGREVDTLTRRRDDLLLAAGVASRDAYAAGLGDASRREELVELLAVAEAELADVAATEPDLAVVEDDFHAFEPKTNAEAVRRMSSELDQLEAEIGTAREARGRLDEEIANRADDPQRRDLEYDLARIEHDVARHAEELAAAEAAVRAVEAARGDLETNTQPPLLLAASEHLGKLTGGRYRAIRSPFGEKTLEVVGDGGRAFSPGELSRGTREQLFLALRFALIDGFAEEGVKLPVVLDDVFVNFDEGRTRAAVETVAEMADRGRQVIYLTCHRHVAKTFAEFDARVLDLPAHVGSGRETLIAG